MLRLTPIALLLAGAAGAGELTPQQRSILSDVGIVSVTRLNDQILREITSRLPREEGSETSAADDAWIKLTLPSIRRSLDRHDRWNKNPSSVPSGKEREEALNSMGEHLKPDLLGEFGARPVSNPPPRTEHVRDERPVQQPARLETRTVPAATTPKPAKPAEEKPEWRRIWDDMVDLTFGAD